VISGWAWEGTAPGAAGCGVSDEEDRARQAAEKWLTDHPGAVAVLGTARLADGTTTLSAWWDRVGQVRRSRRLRDGRITWARIPVQRQAPGRGPGERGPLALPGAGRGPAPGDRGQERNGKRQTPNRKATVMTITRDNPAHAPVTDRPLRSLWAEVTGKCQLTCTHCYAGSGPDGTHGTMTADEWERVLAEAAALGTRMVCFIGGEPTLYPFLPRLARHALTLGMEAEVFSNLVHVTPELWELFETPGVRLATSWYSSDRPEHKQITGRDTWRQTLASIEEAIRRNIPLRVGLIDGIVSGQHTEEGAELLRARGVTDIGGDHLREFGRGTNPDPAQACGNCGHHRAAVLPDGTVTPCPLTRWMNAGNVTSTPLADIVGTVTQMAATLPARQRKCAPEECPPDWKCRPYLACRPDARTVQSGNAIRACNPDCVPDSFCNPLCIPGACKPRV
jgi:MoaA/NifB/PqqE/SkfB family radical SAM enzyme